MMNVIIRADSSFRIGSGHVMRCLTLAKGLREKGARVSFICRDLPGNIYPLIELKKFPVFLLPGSAERFPGSEMDPSIQLNWEWEHDAWETENIISSIDVQPDWLILDHYRLDKNWETALRGYVKKIMVIDDLANRPHDCDLLLDQNYCLDFDTRYANLVSKKCQKLLGPRYALLRNEFNQARSAHKVRNGKVHRILISYGGTDPTKETQKALEAVRKLKRSDLITDVVVGAANPHRAEIEALCRETPGAVYHYQIDHLAGLMAAADIALGAGGGTNWERCCLGLPAIVTTVAQNQEDLAAYCADQGILFWLGKSESVEITDIVEALSLFLRNPVNLRNYVRNGLQLVDGKGVARVISNLIPLPILLRKATEDDRDAVYVWRNDEETRSHNFNTKLIPHEEHNEWYRDSLRNPKRIILIGDIEGSPVGVVRYDIQGDEALISVYLVPGRHGQGFGTQLIRAGSEWLKQNRPEVGRVKAEVLASNRSSYKAFQNAGYYEQFATLIEDLK